MKFPETGQGKPLSPYMAAKPERHSAFIHCGPLDKVDVGDRVRIFLGGSIEMGKAPDWQAAFADKIAFLPIAAFNPRRIHWDLNWKQDIKDKNLHHQMDWEMTNLDEADLIILYLHPGTISPISLLELGRFSRSGKLIVCCPEGYHRRGNVQYICKKDDVLLLEDFDELVQTAIAKLEEIFGKRKK
ncbi:hypothetical protein K491DRAFT_697070 [Lophiostoma macrostomum CBS 122681]|uniref:Uncharacterized protein n=1 Tax=Lophiostoma macrostomum CBS 122681 TaxID=1314788 RepID=A0A6A6SUM4_9PLEO|nr:hypothetical protein K491DRAFT_697070 [Lophiostoma macrostomum CBS 122681]